MGPWGDRRSVGGRRVVWGGRRRVGYAVYDRWGVGCVVCGVIGEEFVCGVVGGMWVVRVACWTMTGCFVVCGV